MSLSLKYAAKPPSTQIIKTTVKRVIRSVYHTIAYHFLYRRELERTTNTRLNSFELTIEPTVLHPKIFRSSEVFASYLSSIDFRDKHVLDVGTGSGVLALIIAARGASVTATDINPIAVRCAAENVRRNGFEVKVKTLQGHLFDPLTENDFDIIVFNPPYLTKRSASVHDVSLYGGDKLKLLREFASSARGYLNPEGYILLIVSTDSNIDLVLNIFREQSYRGHLMRRVTAPFEEFHIYKFFPRTRAIRNVSFACPSCHGNIIPSENSWRCEKESLSFDIDKGIPNFLLPSRRGEVSRFLEIYQAVRKSEGWGSDNPDYYRTLPYLDTSGRHRDIWKIRSKSFDAFVRDITKYGTEAKTILDLGAGNCWLSNRLAREGFDVTAVDLNVDAYDGMGTVQRIDGKEKTEFTCIRAEFDNLPFQPEAFDFIVFNASLHYSKDPYATVMNVQDFLKERGAIYVLDSPIYQESSSGRAMVQERKDDVRRRLGLDVPEEFSGSFLTYDELRQLGSKFCLDLVSPNYGLQWRARHVISSLLNKREPASFEIIKLTKQSATLL